MDWDGVASTYRWQLWLERAAIGTMLDLMEVGPHDRLLDVATGPAPLLARLARREGPPCEAVGIDASEAMLAVARKLPDGWRLERADATALPFDDASFDRITAAYLLHTLDQGVRAEVLGECLRVLRPGGLLGTITIAPPRSALARTLSAPLRRAAERSDGALTGLRPLDPRAALEQAGFRELRRRRSLSGYPSLCVVAEPEHD